MGPLARRMRSRTAHSPPGIENRRLRRRYVRNPSRVLPALRRLAVCGRSVGGRDRIVHQADLVSGPKRVRPCEPMLNHAEAKTVLKQWLATEVYFGNEIKTALAVVNASSFPQRPAEGSARYAHGGRQSPWQDANFTASIPAPTTLCSASFEPLGCVAARATRR